MKIPAALLVLAITGLQSHADPSEPENLLEARKGFATTLLHQTSENLAVAAPPAGVLNVVRYLSPAGEMAAYLTPPPDDGKRHPAIIWLFGGFSNSIDSRAWESVPLETDQSARAFREAGIITLYPSLRGGNQNPGFKEGLYGEVDDVLAARGFLAKQSGVDPDRIYLGGHSVGGTLALLTASAGGGFRAVFPLGPVMTVASYGQGNLPFNVHDTAEIKLRSPFRWLSMIHSPTFVFEGEEKDFGNIGSLKALERANHNPLLHFHPVPGRNHFSAITPVTQLLARRIIDDTGPACSIKIEPKDLIDTASH